MKQIVLIFLSLTLTHSLNAAEVSGSEIEPYREAIRLGMANKDFTDCKNNGNPSDVFYWLAHSENLEIKEDGTQPSLTFKWKASDCLAIIKIYTSSDFTQVERYVQECLAVSSQSENVGTLLKPNIKTVEKYKVTSGRDCSLVEKKN